VSDDGGPVLWHIPISHYNEKARWALAWKGIEHERRAPPPGAHQLIALALTRGDVNTFPVLRLDGRNVGDSTAIIAALEERHPDPPLYPDDPGERERALELEEFFDEELGPDIRLWAYHQLLSEPKSFEQIARGIAPGPLKAVAAPMARTMVKVRFGAHDEEKAAAAQEKVLTALDRLDDELDGNEYLVGDRFSVADLTAGSLFYPLVTPPEGPRIPSTTEAFERFRGPLRDRPGYRHVEEMFRRHRKPATAPG
jgi:glutathione S-transferase